MPQTHGITITFIKNNIINFIIFIYMNLKKINPLAWWWNKGFMFIKQNVNNKVFNYRKKIVFQSFTYSYQNNTFYIGYIYNIYLI